MYYNILTQEDYPEYVQIKKVVKSLRLFVEIDTVYFSKQIEGSDISIITVIISKKSPNYYDEVYEFLWKFFKSYPQFSFCLSDKSWVKEELEEGNVFFILHCNENKLIYNKASKKGVFDIRKINSNELIQKFDQRYTDDTSESRTISRDLRYYINSDNYLMSAYNLHQQFRYMFISVSWFLTGEYVIAHSLQDHYRHLVKFCHFPNKIFDSLKEEEWSVLKQLDNACEAIQYGHKIEPITSDTIVIASEKIDVFRTEAGQLFQECMKKTKLIFEDYGN